MPSSETKCPYCGYEHALVSSIGDLWCPKCKNGYLK